MHLSNPDIRSVKRRGDVNLLETDIYVVCRRGSRHEPDSNREKRYPRTAVQELYRNGANTPNFEILLAQEELLDGIFSLLGITEEQIRDAGYSGLRS